MTQRHIKTLTAPQAALGLRALLLLSRLWACHSARPLRGGSSAENHLRPSRL